MIPPDAHLLCLYLNASHRWHGKPLYQAAVEAARSLHLAGASVFLVDMSYGAHRRLRDAKSEYLFVDVPVVIDIIDAPDRIEVMLSELGEMVADGLTTVEPVRVVSYTHHQQEGRSRGAGGPPVAAPAVVGPPDSPGEDAAMPSEGEVRRVTVYIGSSDTWHGHNLAAAIVDRCRRMGLAGATASLGVLGFGKHSRIHRAHLFGLSQDLPEKVEIIDRAERIAELLPVLEEMVDGGLIIVQDVRAIRYSHHSGSA